MSDHMPWLNTPATARPHTRRRTGETDAQWFDRLAHSCYWCGEHYQDMPALSLHEDGCGR